MPPSATTRARNCEAFTRTASLDRSPHAVCGSVLALTYVPTPPFHSRSTGAVRIREISSSGDRASTASSMPRADRACGDSGTDLALRGQTPPPAEISDRS